jgi:hypothetical protein
MKTFLARALVALALAGCSDGEPTPECGRFAAEVIAVEYGPGQDFGRDAMPDVALGAPQGAGCCRGSLDVVSLGNGGTITLGFGRSVMLDAPGPDFVVFENAFETPAGDVFAELATVEVSADGEVWAGWPCTATEEPWGACAGAAPVLLAADEAIDPATAGGDAFDLAAAAVAEARFVRITDRVDLGGFEGVFDLDAVGLVHFECR